MSHVGARRLRRWPLAILTAADRLANAVLLGDDRETLSGRAWFARRDGKWWGWLADSLDAIARRFGQTDHCRKAAEFDAAVRKVTEEGLTL